MEGEDIFFHEKRDDRLEQIAAIRGIADTYLDYWDDNKYNEYSGEANRRIFLMNILEALDEFTDYLVKSNWSLSEVVLKVKEKLFLIKK